MMQSATPITRNRPPHLLRALLASLAIACLVFPASTFADDLSTIGITQLRALRPDLTGVNVSVAQVEATTYDNPNDPNGTAPYDPQFDADNFAVNPANVFSGPSNPTITYVGKTGTPTTTFNSSQSSSHADTVGGNIFGTTTGAAPGISAVLNYNANYFFNNIIEHSQTIQSPLAPAGAPPVSIINQSFTFGTPAANDTTLINQLYDDYAATTSTLFVTAAGNIDPAHPTVHTVNVPASAYNGISVGDLNGTSDFGPLADGRSKPDIAAPGGFTSFSAPYVSGVAAVLRQAGATGSGGTSSATESAAVDPRTLKALLLNGATKLGGWTNTPTQPLDPVYGTGIVNALNSYQNLAAGQKSPLLTNTSSAPIYGTTTINSGWDLNTLTTAASDTAAHYLINIATPSTFSATLDWFRPAGTITSTDIQVTDINHFDLLLYNLITGALLESISPVDNLQYLYTANLPTGIYDLEVVKLATGAVSPTDTYALAFSTVPLDPSQIAGNLQGGSALPGNPPSTVPEPASLTLLTCGTFLLLRRRP